MANERNGSTAAQEMAEDSASLDSQYFGTSQAVVDRYTHCNLCGATLHFTHVTDFSRNLAHETARCPECGFKARRVVHRLQ